MKAGRKICVIAPYPHLSSVAAKVCEELSLECDICVGNMSEGLELALKAVERGSRVLLSRGGTAILLRNYVKVPVVDIPVTAYDILDALAALRGCKEPIGVIGFRNVIQGSQKVASYLGLATYEFELKAQEEIPSCLDMAARQGIRIIIGDRDAVAQARRLGFEARLIDSGPESFRDALLEAQRVLEAQELEKERRRQIKAIVNHIGDGVIALDENGRITLFNQVASSIFGVQQAEVMNKDPARVMALKPLGEALYSETGKQVYIIHLGDKPVVVNRVPLVEAGQIKGVVITVQDARRIQQVEKEVRKELQRKGFKARFSLEQMVAESAAMQAVVEEARKFAAVDSTILIIGETGTGKEMVAQGIHNASSRREGSFVAVNCASIPESLLESELFGYAPGAFTGARREGKMGLFELAHGGTIFLDEIGEATPGIQAKLLRVLQERQIMRVGDDKMIPIDVRVIAATNKDLRKLVKAGKFREDLYYRLSVLTLNIPPLRERQEDIGPLIDYFWARACARLGKKVVLPQEVLVALLKYKWPGNVRELENVVYRLVLSGEASLSQLERWGLLDTRTLAPVIGSQTSTAEASRKSCIELRGTLKEMEEAIIKTVLEEEGYNQARAARRLGIDRSTLWRKINKVWRKTCKC
ncbi:MAG: hypothetical protein PWR22_1835 [Moorella sp. (in: firmicutes)]|uniref:sigma 54-interacting transcriptional regulator n=1 Tax=Moorella sp. E306M TaxID=2572683 RepID=UPI0010FFC02D|nr:sigma 54-interacting transcriptional regulator [Moorella sp. E306M]MDK2817206.1 hypothetical protein [Moorella sp. (in: firmicutes)]GEA19217.1 sigma-54-dependent Fis family transcriptional regulator [Moorella sp. E306M]